MHISPQTNQITHTPFNWEIRKGKEEFQQWRKTLFFYTLFYDGASKGNPREARVGGIIFDPGQNIVTTFAWGIGRKTNNEAEWLTLLLGIDLIKKENINKIIVFGDSKQIIQKMRTNNNTGATNCCRLYNCIVRLSSNL